MRRLAILFLALVTPCFATIELKQSTARVVRIGPFVDVTDEFTPETGVALGTADEAEALKANGAATVDISAFTWAAVAGADGYYDLSLTAGATDTLGELIIVVQDDSLCRPVRCDFTVVTDNWWDSKYGTDELDTSVVQWTGTAVGAPDTAGYPVVTIKDGTGTGEIDTSSGGVILAATGLDSVTNTNPTGVPANFREKLLWLYMRMGGNKVIKTSSAITTYRDDGTTTATTNTITTVSETQTLGAAQ